MISLLLALMVAQATTAPDAAPAASPQATATDGGAIPRGIGFPRGPRRAPVEMPAVAQGDAFIHNSGSTNAAGFGIVVHPDGTADVADATSGMQHKIVGRAQTKWLFAHLGAARPFADLHAGGCMKSASFGTTTTISYDGATTPDLSCAAGDPSVRELMRTVGVIENQLGIR